MQALLGVIFHFLGGFASGSFYMPYKKVKGWHWESFWIIVGLFSWLIVPPLAVFLTIPSFTDIIRESSSSVIGATFLWACFGELAVLPTVWVSAISACHWAVLLYLACALFWCTDTRSLLPV